ncbi:hypothetical protein TYRP_017734 [Tyrophagus putrescentiae]|nr:hypothetical protein TYRP_017734 [Tyrophagus putrescentiae]
MLEKKELRVLLGDLLSRDEEEEDVPLLLLSDAGRSRLRVEDHIGGVEHLAGGRRGLHQTGLIGANGRPEAVIIGHVVDDAVEAIGVGVAV